LTIHHLIVGLGDIARLHATVLRAEGQTVSFCSRSIARATQYQQQYGGVRAFDSLADALTHPDITSCIICAPPCAHEHLVRQCVAGRRHVLLEKPLAHSLDSATRIVELVRTSDAGRAFMVAEQMDYMPFVAVARSFADAGDQVRYRFVERSTFVPEGWRVSAEMAGRGVLLDLGIHYASFAWQAFGAITHAERTVHESLPGTAIPRHERLTVRHANGVTGDIDVAWAEPQPSASMCVESPKRSLRYVPGDRLAWQGPVPRLVSLRGTTGRPQLTAAYLSECATPTPSGPRMDDALSVLKAVL
jgi:predicted dehydrogenase